MASKQIPRGSIERIPQEIDERGTSGQKPANAIAGRVEGLQRAESLRHCAAGLWLISTSSANESSLAKPTSEVLFPDL
jgi:hypothetical protein